MSRARLQRTMPLVVMLALGALAGCSTASQEARPATEDRLDSRCEQVDFFSGKLAVGVPSSVAAPPTDVSGRTGSPPEYAVRLDSVTVSSAADGTAEVQYVFSGDGFVGWSAKFVDLPTLRGSDADVAVAGSCVIQVDLGGIESEAATPLDTTPQRMADNAATEVIVFPSSDGIGQSFIGTRSRSPQVAIETSRGAQGITVSISPD